MSSPFNKYLISNNRTRVQYPKDIKNEKYLDLYIFYFVRIAIGFREY